MSRSVARPEPIFPVTPSLPWDSIRMRRGLSWLRLSVPVLALVLLFSITGLRGVNYGYHWDEDGWHIAPAQLMVKTGVFLPKNYIYPSLDKYLVLLPAIPPGIRAAIDNAGQPLPIQAAMLKSMQQADFLLRVRGVFIVVSGLAILWMYGAAIALRHKPWEALVAAAGLGLSWEYAYHSRWAVTDCILVQFSALTLFMLALFQRTGGPRWLYAAAVAAGLGTGTKYTGVFLLAPVVMASVLALPWNAFWAQVRRATLLCGLAFAVYLLTTPATILDPFQFMTETRGISEYYKHSHGGYTTTGMLDHVWIVAAYFALVFFSPYQWIALPAFVAMALGALLWFRRDARFALLLVGFPALFLAMFCFRYRVVIIRNYLFVTPFLALLLARGVADLAALLSRRPWPRWGLAAILSGALAVNAAWLIAAGESIRSIDPNLYVRQAIEYVAKHDSIRFRVSPRIRSLARAQGLAMPPNVVKDKEGSQVVFFGTAEGPGDWNWRVNDPWLTKAVFGPREVNFDYYSSWNGHDHIVVMALDKAKATGVPLAR